MPSFTSADDFWDCPKDAMIALWAFATQAKFVDAPRSSGFLVVPSKNTDLAKANQQAVDRFIAASGMHRDSKLETCGVQPFYSVQSMLSGQYFRILDPEQTNVLFATKPHQALHHRAAVGKNTFYMSGTGHFVIGVSSTLDMSVRRASDTGPHLRCYSEGVAIKSKLVHVKCPDLPAIVW